MDHFVDYHLSNQNLGYTITTATIVICIYTIGVCLHLKIVKVSKKEKDLTWKLDVANSIVVLFVYALRIFISTINFIIKDLHTFTGKWFCYASRLVFEYQIEYVSGYSLIISMFKYFVTVHGEILLPVQGNVTLAFLVINFIHPILSIGLHLILVPDYLVRSMPIEAINQCLGAPINNTMVSIPWCQTENIETVDHFSIVGVLYILRRCICSIRVLLHVMIAFNFFEMFFYFKIFAYMRR